MSSFKAFPDGWEIKELKTSQIKIIDGDRGTNYPNKSEFSTEGYCLFLNTGNIKNDSLDFSSCEFISENKNALLRKGKLLKQDIVLTTRGTVGSVAFFHKNIPYEHLRINSGMVILRCDDLSPNYFYHLFKSPLLKTQYLLYSSGSAQPQLPIKDLRRIKLPTPPIDIQNKIAATLSAYDELIENNQRRIELLQKMAEEIYREWFIRLRFPGHENVKAIKGVPELWSIDKVESIGKVVTGKTPSTENTRYFGGEFHFIKTPDMHNNMFIIDTDETLTRDGIDSQKSQTIPQNCICISCIGTGGIVSITTRVCQTNQQINTVVLHEKFQLEWAFFTIRNLKETIQMFGSTGTTMTNLSKGKFSSLKLIRPDQELIKQFHLLVNPMFEQISNLMQQTRLLKKSRDALLPRLISGKLPVESLNIQFPPSMLDDTAPLSK